MIKSGAITVSGVTLQLKVGAKSTTQKAPILVYWHGTGGNAVLAFGEIAPSATSEIMAAGGMILSMESGGMGGAIDWGVFTQGDFDLVDQVVACAVQQLNIDTHRIYTSGSSAGGLAAGTLALQRSSYVAAANPNSGGIAPWPGNNAIKDPAHVPAALTMHGAMGVDAVVIEFATASLDLDKAIVAAGGFAVDCDHGGGHVAAPVALKEAGWTFMKAHSFGTKPSPYVGGLPAGFPAYCKIITK
jgi:predicted esterase